MSILKWILIAAVVLGVAYLVYAKITNTRVSDEVRTNQQGERAGIVMLLTFPDGRVLPVNYLREDNQVFAGADGRWWREFRDGDVPVTVEIRGARFQGRAWVVLDDPAYTRDVFSRLRPNVPKWLPDWLNAYLVVIDLDE